MGQNFDDYPDFQPKITHPKHFSRHRNHFFFSIWKTPKIAEQIYNLQYFATIKLTVLDICHKKDGLLISLPTLFRFLTKSLRHLKSDNILFSIISKSIRDSILKTCTWFDSILQTFNSTENWRQTFVVFLVQGLSTRSAPNKMLSRPSKMHF